MIIQQRVNIMMRLIVTLSLNIELNKKGTLNVKMFHINIVTELRILVALMFLKKNVRMSHGKTVKMFKNKDVSQNHGSIARIIQNKYVKIYTQRFHDRQRKLFRSEYAVRLTDLYCFDFCMGV